MALASSYREALIEGLREGLRAAGFKKRGVLFHRASADVVHLVALQSSIDSPGQIPQVTLNLAVWCKALAPAGTEPTVMAAAWRCRLADVLPAGAVHWWPIAGRDDVPRVARDMSLALKTYGIPALDEVPDSEILRARYRAGRAVQPS